MAFDKCCFRGSGGSYAERQYILPDFALTGGPDSIIISKDGISEYSGDCSRYSFSTRSDLVLDEAMPYIESGGLFYPKGPFISLGYDNKMMIWGDSI